MQSVSQLYLDEMAKIVRNPSKMRLTFHYPTGEIVYTNEDIAKITETKSAHLIAGELPSITLDMELINIDGTFDPNDSSGLHDMIVAGVRVNYEFGYDIPLVKPYGYEGEPEEDNGSEGETAEYFNPVYGISGGVIPQYPYYTDEGFINIPQEAYGFEVGKQTEWVAGGEVFTDGELEYNLEQLTVKITAVDFLSKMDTPIYFGHGQVSLSTIASRVIEQTDYPIDELGNKKLILDSTLDNFITAFNISGNSEEALPAKEWLQTIANAGGVQMYVDRMGYLHLDNNLESVSPSYHLPLLQQKENPEHSKLPLPKKLIININTDYDDPLEVDIGGGGEDLVVDNPYMILKTNAENLRDRIVNNFIPYRNEATIKFRGEPALDVLDRITFDATFEENIEGTIVQSNLTFDGTLEGELVVRYSLGDNAPSKVKISGGGNFVIPLGSGIPIQPSYTLVCETDVDSPTYQWSYFNLRIGKWVTIEGEITDTLEVSFEDPYFNEDDIVTFKCTVNDDRASITRISKIHLVKSPVASYRGAKKLVDPEDIITEVPFPEVGDIVLLDNTDDESEDVTYGETYIYTGENWEPTTASDALSLAYKDALEIAVATKKTMFSAKVYTDLLVANKGFIDELATRGLTITEDGFIESENFSMDEETGLPNSGYRFDVEYEIIEGQRVGKGRLRASNIVATNSLFDKSTVRGALINDALTTREATPEGNPVSLAPKSAWYGNELFTKLSGNKIKESTGTVDSKNIIYTAKIGDGEKVIINEEVISQTGSSGGIVEVNYYVPPLAEEVRVQSTTGGRYAWVGVWHWRDDVQTKINASVFDWAKTIDCEEGDRLQVQYDLYGSNWLFPAGWCTIRISYRLKGEYYNSTWVMYDDFSIQEFKHNTYYEEHLQLSVPITFDSDSYKHFTDITPFIDEVANLPLGVIRDVSDDSVITYDSYIYERIVSVARIPDGIQIFLQNGSVLYFNSRNIDDTLGWYMASGNFKILAVSATALTRNLEPMEKGSDIGTLNAPYNLAHITNVSYPLITEEATLDPLTNEIIMEDIVPTLGLEIGDVIQIIGGGDNDGRLHTVEDIEDDDSIVVNYEHCGGRGNGSLKLFDYSGNLIIKLIAKWWQAPIGLGQAWVDVVDDRSFGQEYENTTNRTIKVWLSNRSTATNSQIATFSILINNEITHQQNLYVVSTSYRGNIGPFEITHGGTYKGSSSQYFAKGVWSELR